MVTPTNEGLGAPSGASHARSVTHSWGPGGPRVFISHTHDHREDVGKLAEALRSFGLACFVAHDDIIPSVQWLRAIESALSTCDVLVAYVTPDFCRSDWCDQEVGWALGLGVPGIPVRVGADPYGFLGEFQGISLPKKYNDPMLGDSVLRALATIAYGGGAAPLRQQVTAAIVTAFEKSGSFDTTRHRFSLLLMIPTEQWTDPLRARLREACGSNGQIRIAGIAEGAHKGQLAPEAVETLLATHSSA